MDKSPKLTEVQALGWSVEKMGAWDWMNDPTKDGWYAVLTCYDPAEGIFPKAAEWRGGWVDKPGPISARSPERFPSERMAKRWAEEHDIEG